MTRASMKNKQDILKSIMKYLIYCSLHQKYKNIGKSFDLLTRTTCVEIIQSSVVQPSESLVPLGIFAAQLKAILKPLEHHGNFVLKSLCGVFNWAPIMSRGVSRSDGWWWNSQSGRSMNQPVTLPTNLIPYHSWNRKTVSETVSIILHYDNKVRLKATTDWVTTKSYQFPEGINPTSQNFF